MTEYWHDLCGIAIRCGRFLFVPDTSQGRFPLLVGHSSNKNMPLVLMVSQVFFVCHLLQLETLNSELGYFANSLCRLYTKVARNTQLLCIIFRFTANTYHLYEAMWLACSSAWVGWFV